MIVKNSAHLFYIHIESFPASHGLRFGDLGDWKRSWMFWGHELQILMSNWCDIIYTIITYKFQIKNEVLRATFDSILSEQRLAYVRNVDSTILFYQNEVSGGRVQ